MAAWWGAPCAKGHCSASGSHGQLSHFLQLLCRKDGPEAPDASEKVIMLSCGLLPQCDVVAVEGGFSRRFSSHLNDSQASIVYQILLCAEHMLDFLVSMHGDVVMSCDFTKHKDNPLPDSLIVVLILQSFAHTDTQFCFTLQGLHYTFVQQVTVTLQGDVPVT